MSTLRIVDAVFERLPSSRPRHRLLAAVGLGLGLHCAVLLWAVASAPSLETWSAELAVRVHAELTRTEMVELPPPPPPEKPPPPPEKAPPPPVKLPPVAKVHSAPSPAQAGKILTAAPKAPLDLPGTTFVTGTAKTYAGGVTTATGKSQVAVTGPISQSGPPAAKAPAGPPEEDHSSPIAVDDTDWSCPWPREADSQQIDEQSVMIQVVVRSDGSAESAKVLSDPGHGFAAAARACALANRYTPAHNKQGNPIRAESPPILVHFNR